MKQASKYLLTGSVVLIAVGLVLLKYWDYVVNPWTRDGQVRANVIQVTPRVSGPIVSLSVRDNQFVGAGELLFKIDPRTFQASLDEARAQYDVAADSYLAQEKQVEAAQAQVEVSRAAVLQAQSSIKEYASTIQKNRAELRRQQELLPQKATSQKSLERAQANYDISVEQRRGAEAALAQSRSSLTQAEADLAEVRANLGAAGQANASLRKAQSAVRQAELNLEFTEVRASVDGYVTNLDLRLGSQAVANQPALALVDVNSYWIDGFFKENEIGPMASGDRSIITLMTYPDKPLEGVVDSIGWGIAQQDGSTGADLLPTVNPTFEWIRLAQRVPVRISIKTLPEGIALRVGTSASVLVMTGRGSDGHETVPAAPALLQ
ncbi:HlyD family secretion protein [Aestuariirhabdus sp. LZHN29]|uniref:HlyD family secretion protein n=1 Tax=Aestuariirhabdus sp. LZHN29 TaxID=3417462 RepID=UPI003CF7352C